MRMDRLSSERERERKVKDDLSKHSHSSWANKLNSDLSFYLTRDNSEVYIENSWDKEWLAF